MNTKLATGPAWQVRESARQTFLEGLLRKTRRLEDRIGRMNVYRILLYFLDQRLAGHGIGISIDTLSEIPWSLRENVHGFFHEIVKEVRVFARTKEEGAMLFGKLLENAAREIADPSGRALRNQEFFEPKLIYRTESATDEVPLE